MSLRRPDSFFQNILQDVLVFRVFLPHNKLFQKKQGSTQQFLYHPCNAFIHLKYHSQESRFVSGAYSGTILTLIIPQLILTIHIECVFKFLIQYTCNLNSFSKNLYCWFLFYNESLGMLLILQICGTPSFPPSSTVLCFFLLQFVFPPSKL